VRAKKMIEASEIGEPQMIRLHVNTGTLNTAWEVPISALAWRFDENRCGGGPLIFDHGYHLFSPAHFINRYTARTVDLPELMMFRDGKTTAIPVEGVKWHDSFIACTQHLIDVLRDGGQPVLDGPTGKAVLQFTLAALISAREGQEVRPDDGGGEGTAPSTSPLPPVI
jgi:hypothetical protein